ncbi:MAG: ATP phosphoribosyltransferase regulatory subunit, partial [Coriobacteriales bacterium]|nr:ATP phosphoribosyltransferase regulatory subunit [Coriobacteriales bacterium]
NYYNAIGFRGFVQGISSSVISGGQYDLLMRKMGRKSGAIGSRATWTCSRSSTRSSRPTTSIRSSCTAQTTTSRRLPRRRRSRARRGRA